MIAVTPNTLMKAPPGCRRGVMDRRSVSGFACPARPEHHGAEGQQYEAGQPSQGCRHASDCGGDRTSADHRQARVERVDSGGSQAAGGCDSPSTVRAGHHDQRADGADGNRHRETGNDPAEQCGDHDNLGTPSSAGFCCTTIAKSASADRAAAEGDVMGGDHSSATFRTPCEFSRLEPRVRELWRGPSIILDRTATST